jgi:hypothetical protein
MLTNATPIQNKKSSVDASTLDLKEIVNQKPKISLGVPPVDLNALIRQTIQSNTSPLRTLIEYTENSMDANSHRIDVEISGEVINDSIHVSSVRIKDDGDGMSEIIFSKNFRGMAWYNSAHNDTGKHGKNCIGAKSGLDFFTYIDIATTTADLIEEFPDPLSFENPVDQNLYSETRMIHNYCSKLLPGEEDTELRTYRMGMLSTEILQPWEFCDAADHGTIVYLNTPLPGREMIIPIKELKRSLSTHFLWLAEQNDWNAQNTETAKKRMRGLFLKIPGEKWEPIMPFDNGWSSSKYNQSNPHGSYLLITGTISKGLDIEYINPKGIIEKIPGKERIPAIELSADEQKRFGLENGDVSVWLQLTYGMANENKDLLVSISGSVVTPPWEIKNKISSGGGFDSAIRGKIYSQNLMLKRSLRHNRTALDMGDALVKKFWNYIYGTVYAYMSVYFRAFTEDSTTMSTDTAVKDAMESLKFLFIGKDHETRGENKNTRWECSSCGHIFLFDKNRLPSMCPKCNCPNLSPYSGKETGPSTPHGQTNNSKGVPDFEFVSSLGYFIPVRYNPTTEKFQLVQNHPEFTQDAFTATKWTPIRRERIIHHALIAWTAYQMSLNGQNGEDFLQRYGQVLKHNFLNDLKRKKAIEIKWAEKEDPKIFVDKNNSSFE